MEKVRILIIGAGVVGLAIAEKLSQYFEDLVVVEKETSFGRHTSSRNSEVIHSGIYYPKDSFKAKFCVNGNRLLYQYCTENEIPHKKTGKLVVASSENEIEQLEGLQEKGRINGVSDLQIFDEKKVNELEPKIKAKAALLVPSTGILDTHKLMEDLENRIEKNDGFVIYDMEVKSIEYKDKKFFVSFTNEEVYCANILVNSAGLFSDSISAMLGIKKAENKSLKLHWCKGEYYKSNKIGNVKHLIYPLPDPSGVFLGIHLTLNLNNEVRFGPNAYYVDDLNYKMDDINKNDFLTAINRYINVGEEDLHLDDCGIRPKLQGPDDDFRDFYIQEETGKGFPNFINLIGIESPGLTCCFSIANYVKSLIKED